MSETAGLLTQLSTIEWPKHVQQYRHATCLEGHQNSTRARDLFVLSAQKTQKAMEERDAERLKRMAAEAVERAAANAAKKKKAEQRIAGGFV